MNLTKSLVAGITSAQNMWRTVIVRNRSVDHAKDYASENKTSGSTVDSAELKLFESFKNTWWDTYGQLKPLHSMNPLRIQFIRDGLMNAGFTETNPALPLEGIKIIDIGCGGGILAEPLARIGANVTGIDASSELITMAKHHASLDNSISQNLNYICATVENLAQTDAEKYDAVVASEVIEHVESQELFLESCVQLLKPGGSLFITTFNKTYLSWLGGIIAAEYLLQIIPMGTHNWNKFIPPTDVQRILERYGCRTRLVHGIIYNPLKNEWCWSFLDSVTYALHAIKRKSA